MEALADLVDGNDVFPACGADRDAVGTDELERRVPRHHPVVNVGAGQNVLKAQGRVGVKVGLVKTAEARPDLHAGQDAARVLVERTHQAGAVLHRRFAHPRVEHGAEGNVAHIAAGPHDHCPASADVDDLLGFVDIAVARIALQPFASLGTEARRVACLDTDNPARIATLADDFVQVPVEHEPDARLAGAVFNRARDDEAAAYAVRSTNGVGLRSGATAGAGVEE